jgi:CRISP-associated protein Cas1
MQLHLNSYGAYLHVKDAMFDIRKKQEDGEWSSTALAAHKIKSIWMGRGTALSSDAAALALKNNIDIVFMENDGVPLGRIWHSRLGSTTQIRKQQLEATADNRALQFTKLWLAEKLANQADFIRDLKKHRPQHHQYLTTKIEKIDTLGAAIQALDGNTLDGSLAGTIHGLEGTAGRLYFETLSYVLPPAWQFNGRSSRPAKDPFNAFLNYAYGVLYARVEKVLILAGLDPYVGFLHRDDYNYKSLVYDFIEPYRFWADKVVFSLFSAKKVNQTHTVNIANGGCSLNNEGKKLLMEHYNSYLEEEVIRYKNKNRTRANILLLDAHRFGQEIMGKTPGERDIEPEIKQI